MTMQVKLVRYTPEPERTVAMLACVILPLVLPNWKKKSVMSRLLNWCVSW